MHKTNRIHIGKTPYDIEVDAGASLKRYMVDLRSALGADAGKDTMADIELHITEILAGRQVQPGGVITTEDVEAIKEQLGEPDQLQDSSEHTDARKRGKRFFWLGALGLTLLLAGVSAFVWRDQLFPGRVMNKTEQHTYERSIKSLKVDIESGSATVRAGQGNQVTVERHFKWAGTKPTFTEEWKGEQLLINTNCPEDQRNCSLDYVIYLPSTVPVDLHTNAGPIDIEDMTGELRLATSAGNVDVTGAKGNVWTRVSDGNITVSGQSAEVDLQTSSGNIDLYFNTAPMQVNARASAGNIEIVVPFGSSYAVRAETSSGRRTVSVEQASSAMRHIDARTSSGDVTVQYPQN